MTGTLTVRTTTPADLPEIDALLGRSYPALLKADYPPSTLVTAVPLLSRANPALLACGTYFAVTDEDDVIVGAGGWTRSAPPGFERKAQIGSIRHVVTDHRRTREGIGTRLLAHIFSTARETGMRSLDCLSTRTAVPFYSACGFRSFGPVTINLRPGIDFAAVRMQRLL